MPRFSILSESAAPPKKRDRSQKGFRPKVLLNCDECGKKFLRDRHVQIDRMKHQKQTKNWCSKTCQGRYLGSHGWGANNYTPSPDFASLEWQGPYELDGAIGWIADAA